MKKIVSLILVLVMLTAVLCVRATASYSIISDEGRLPFEDVKESHWFYDAIRLCYANGIVKGMNEYTYDFNGFLTRAQFVTMLASLEGVDTSNHTVDKFSDVKSTHWYYGVVAWAYNEGIVNGMSETAFKPNAVLTRAQLAVIMNNYMQDNYDVEISEDVIEGFTDKPKRGYWYYDAMLYTVSAGLLSGNSNGTLAATDNVTRAQAAVLFRAFMEQYFYGECEHIFTEADCTNPPICENCGFINGLAKGHSMPTTYNCKTSKLCFVCNAKVEPSSIHDFAPANCGNPRICRVCGIKRGEPVGDHEDMWSPTCTNPAMCKTCYHTVGSPLGHTTSNGVCGRCGIANFTDKYLRTVHHIKSVGDYDPETNTYSYLLTRGSLHINHGYYSVRFDYYSFIVYHVATDSIEISNVRSNSWHDDVELSAILINRYDTKCKLAYSYYNSKGKLERYAEGFIDKTNYTTGALPSFSKCELGGEDMYTVRYSCGQNLDLALNSFHYKLKDCYGGGMNDLGFTSYSPNIPKE